MNLVDNDYNELPPLKYPLGVYRAIGAATVLTEVKLGSVEFLDMINQTGLLPLALGSCNQAYTEEFVAEVRSMVARDRIVANNQDPRMIAFFAGANDNYRG